MDTNDKDGEIGDESTSECLQVKSADEEETTDGNGTSNESRLLEKESEIDKDKQAEADQRYLGGAKAELANSSTDTSETASEVKFVIEEQGDKSIEPFHKTKQKKRYHKKKHKKGHFPKDIDRSPAVRPEHGPRPKVYSNRTPFLDADLERKRTIADQAAGMSRAVLNLGDHEEPEKERYNPVHSLDDSTNQNINVAPPGSPFAATIHQLDNTLSGSTQISVYENLHYRNVSFHCTGMQDDVALCKRDNDIQMSRDTATRGMKRTHTPHFTGIQVSQNLPLQERKDEEEVCVDDRTFTERNSTLAPLTHDQDADDRPSTTIRENTDDEFYQISSSIRQMILNDYTEIEVGPRQEIVKFKAPSLTKPFPFKITSRGCVVFSSYCELYCPPGAVLRPLEVTMEPEYYPQDTLENGDIFITPYIKFTSNSSHVIKFEKDVDLMIHTSYASVDLNIPVPVKMIRKSGEEIYVTDGAAMLEKDSITFKCRQFCRVSGALAADQFPNTKRGYKSAAYFRRESTTATAIVHWLIYDDIALLRKEREKYLGKQKIAFDPEPFSLRYADKLQLKIMGANSVKPTKQVLSLEEYYGKKIEKSMQFALEWEGSRSSSTSTLHSEISFIRDGSTTALTSNDFHYLRNDGGSQNPTPTTTAAN